MLNPGFTAKVREDEMIVDAGPVIRCPNCKKSLMEAVADKIKTRCKHCGRWVYLQRVDS